MNISYRNIKHFSIILIVILSLAGYQSSQAQEAYTVKYWSESDSQSIDRFLSEIQVSLDEYNIELVEHSPESSITPSNQIALLFFRDVYVDDDNTINQIVSIQTQTDVMSELSIILSSDTWSGIDINQVHADDLVIGLLLYSSNYFDEAEIYLSSVKQEDMHLGLIQFYQGNLALIRNDYELAINLFEQNGRLPTANLAWAYLQNNQEDKAFVLLADEINNARENSRTANVIYFLSLSARIYALTLDYDSAIADINEAIGIAEENETDNQTLAELYTIRGEIIFLIYEWDRVENNFDTAIELNPEYARAYFQRGVLFYTMARREHALTDFQTYLELDADGIDAEEAQSYIDSIETELEALGG